MRPVARGHRFASANRLAVPQCRSLVTGSSEADSVSLQNRKRALEYMQQYAKEETFQEDVIAHEPLSSSTSRSKPSAKELARARLKKHIPIVTGRLPSTDQLAKLIESEHGAQNVVVLDVRQKASFADWLVLCCGYTANHVLAIADGIAQDMRALDVLVNGEIITVSGRNSTDWMVVDIGPVVVHVMTDEARDQYRLEDLWQPERAPAKESSDGFHGSLS